MKPSPFDYSRPEALPEALELLERFGPDAKILAGGQSLLPLLSMRLAAPSQLIDINRLATLQYVRAEADGVRVGALARHAELERDEPAYRAQPLLRRALRHVAHPTIRNRGTTVGSIAHADPAGEMTTVLSLLAGSVSLASTGGNRDVAAADFFLGPLESALAPTELLTEAFFPALPARSGAAFVEVSRRHGDYAVCGVGAVVALDADLHVSSARVGLLSMAPTPLVLDVTEVVRGRPFDADLSAVADAVRASVAPEADIHASVGYRRHLAGVLSARALSAAALDGAR